jgi:hypothetical protein
MKYSVDQIMPRVMASDHSSDNGSIPVNKSMKHSNSELMILTQPNQIEQQEIIAGSSNSKEDQILKIQKKKQDLVYEGEESEEEDEADAEEEEEEVKVDLQPKIGYFR